MNDNYLFFLNIYKTAEHLKGMSCSNTKSYVYTKTQKAKNTKYKKPLLI